MVGKVYDEEREIYRELGNKTIKEVGIPSRVYRGKWKNAAEGRIDI